MVTRYRVLQMAVALLVALGSVALGGSWAWAQQEEVNPAARQDGQCQGAEEIGTVGPTDRNVTVVEFRTDGDKFRLTYKITDLDDNGVPLLDATVLDEDDDEVGGQIIREQGTETEIVTENPGTFTLEITAEDLTYEITVEDCTGKDQSSGNNGSNGNNRSNGNNGSSGNNRSATTGQYGRGLGDDLGIGNDLGLGDNPGLGIGQDAGIPEDVITETIPNKPLPDTGGMPLFGLAVIGLACVGLGVAALRSAIRRLW